MKADPTSALLAAAKKKRQQMLVVNKPDPNERLEDFMVRMDSNLTRPMHLGRGLEIMNEVRSAPIRLLLSVPPRHGKTFCLLHLMAMRFIQNPKISVAYITHSEPFAIIQSRKVRDICQSAGVQLNNSVASGTYWETKNGGSFYASGVSGGAMGRGFDLLVIDDPYQDMSDLDSPLTREGVQDMFDAKLKSRIEPGGSIVIIHTRYHPEDLIATLWNRDQAKVPAERVGWEYINIPALNDNGEALWPARYPASELLKLKAENEFVFAAMYMGTPRPRGMSIFNEVHTFTEEELAKIMPEAVAIGIDCAYTSKSYSDYSVALTGYKYQGCLYIVDMVRRQVPVTTFAGDLRALKARHPRATIFWFIGPAEKPILQLLTNLRVYIRYEKGMANDKKYEKAQAVASMWNQGRVKILKSAPWKTDLVNEVLSFTGLGDRHDDIVDALASVHWPLFGKSVARGTSKTPIGTF
jgi:predicted phage terminase large subunit-like protein